MRKKLGWLLSFLKIGAIGFGGGTSLIPVIEHEMVNSKKLVTKEEYDSAVIAASITPGALPVEISSYIGKDIAGIKGMLMAPACMILPGVVLTVVMLTAMDSFNEGAIRQIEILSIGITAFIFSMMTKYISGTFKWAKTKKRTGAAFAVVACVFLLSAGKAFGRILGTMGIEWNPVLSISTVHILIMSFFVICYAGSIKDRKSCIISVVICIIYILFKSNSQIMHMVIGNSQLELIMFRSLQLIMAGLSVYGVVSVRDKDEPVIINSPRGMIKECIIWLAIFILACIPAYLMVPELLKFAGNGFLSSLISFGGGDAYLTVADGMFVDKGIISEDDFYGRLVILVNVLPGSILCKTLTGVGYYYGYGFGGMPAALATAFSGFVCSIIGSCFTMTIVRYFFDIFEKVRAFGILKMCIKAIISGLLCTVALSLIYQCFAFADGYQARCISILIMLALIYFMNIFLEKKFELGTWINVIISIGAALLMGNLII